MQWTNLPFFSLSCAIPELPGKHQIFSTSNTLANAQTIECALPSLPTTSTVLIIYKFCFDERLCSDYTYYFEKYNKTTPELKRVWGGMRRRTSRSESVKKEK